MAIVSISQLPIANSAKSSDLLLIVSEPVANSNSSPVTSSITISNLLGSLNTVSANTNVIFNLNTPANSSIQIVQGVLFFDENYGYVSVANNVLKRFQLEAF